MEEASWHQRGCERWLSSFTLGTALGEGAFGIVLNAKSAHYPGELALKITNKENPAVQNPSVLHRVRAEARVLRKLSSPSPHASIVRCFGAVESAQIVALVLSREAGQSLAHYVSDSGAMVEDKAAPIALQVARALRHCHARKICHRDVKLDNVVWDESSGRAVLCDFGLALAVRTQGGSRLDVRCGSHEYMAPELLDPSSKGYYGPAVDMWALGVLVYTLLCGQFPFGRVQTKICRGQFAKPPLDEHRVTTNGREWIGSCLEVDPNSTQKVNRLSSTDACRHAWLRPHEAAADSIAAAVASVAAENAAGDSALTEAVRHLQEQAQVEVTGGEESTVDGAAVVDSERPGIKVTEESQGEAVGGSSDRAVEDAARDRLLMLSGADEDD